MSPHHHHPGLSTPQERPLTHITPAAHGLAYGGCSLHCPGQETHGHQYILAFQECLVTIDTRPQEMPHEVKVGGKRSRGSADMPWLCRVLGLTHLPGSSLLRQPYLQCSHGHQGSLSVFSNTQAGGRGELHGPCLLSAPKPLKPPPIGIRMSSANESGMTSLSAWGSASISKGSLALCPEDTCTSGSASDQ